MEALFLGQVVNTVYLTQQVIAHHRSAPSLTVVDIGSAAATIRPERRFGEGGSAFAYCAAKAALHQQAPFLDLEYGDQGVRAFTLNPGFVRTETLLEILGDVPGASAPEVTAEVVRWLATSPEADALRGQYLNAQDLHTAISGAPRGASPISIPTE